MGFDYSSANCIIPPSYNKNPVLFRQQSWPYKLHIHFTVKLLKWVSSSWAFFSLPKRLKSRNIWCTGLTRTMDGIICPTRTHGCPHPDQKNPKPYFLWNISFFSLLLDFVNIIIEEHSHNYSRTTLSCQSIFIGPTNLIYYVSPL